MKPLGISPLFQLPVDPKSLHVIVIKFDIMNIHPGKSIINCQNEEERMRILVNTYNSLDLYKSEVSWIKFFFYSIYAQFYFTYCLFTQVIQVTRISHFFCKSMNFPPSHQIISLCWISNLSHSPGFWGCFSSEIRFSKNILLELHIKITLLKWLNLIPLRNVQVVLSFNSHLSSLLEVFKIKAKEWLGQVLVDLVLDVNILFRRILTCDQWLTFLLSNLVMGDSTGREEAPYTSAIRFLKMMSLWWGRKDGPVEVMSKLMTVGEITEAHQRTTKSISFDWGQRRLKCLKWSPLPAMSTNFPRICWDYTKIRAGGEDLKNRFPATDKAYDGLYLFVDTSVYHVWEHSLTMCWPQHNWETCSSCAWK